MRTVHGSTIFGIIAAMWSVSPAQAADPGLARCLADVADVQSFSGAALVARKGLKADIARGDVVPGGGHIVSDTRFNIGSAGKMFTAVAIAQLIEAKKIALDDPIARYVDGLTPETGAVSIRQLLTHSGGLGNFFVPENVGAMQAMRDLGDLKPLLADDRPAFNPGSRFAYSNNGYLLLGLAIERASGERYADYLRGHVFAPAGMTASSLDPGPGSFRAIGLTQGMPQGPNGPAGERRGPPPGAGGPPPGEMRGPGPNGPLPAGSNLPLKPSAESALPGTSAGGVYSTVGDLERFLFALEAGKLVGEPMGVMLTSAQIVSGPARGDLPALNYGLGFGTSSYDGHRWFGHNGGAPGVNAEVVRFPNDDVTIVVLANRDPPAASELLRAIRPKLLTGGCSQP
jgi:D-alanyl-D-alanine carboxypeptidase